MKNRDRLLLKTGIIIVLLLSYNIDNATEKVSYERKFISPSTKIELHESLDGYDKKHLNFLRESAPECTLFLNKNEEFPINNPCSVLLLGYGARKTIKGGTGSGDIASKFSSFEQGLENAGFKITTKNWLNQKKYPLLKEHNTVKADIAIYVISRNSGQGMDREISKGDVLLTDEEINDILFLNKNYKKFMLVLNTCGVVDLSPACFKGIKYFINISIRFSSRGYSGRYYSWESKPNWKVGHNLDKN